MRSTCTQYRKRHTIIEGGGKEPIHSGINAIVWWKNHENLFIFLWGGREQLFTIPQTSPAVCTRNSTVTATQYVSLYIAQKYTRTNIQTHFQR